MLTENPAQTGTDPLRTSVRFPLHMEIVLSTAEREYRAVTVDVSANGVSFFSKDDLPPVDSHVEFRMTMPAAVMGGKEDVHLNCIGRIVRYARESEDKVTAAAVIDDYSLKG
ncbi:MAG: PilZ domain-containing protein [Bryocella sp.]